MQGNLPDIADALGVPALPELVQRAVPAGIAEPPAHRVGHIQEVATADLLEELEAPREMPAREHEVVLLRRPHGDRLAATDDALLDDLLVLDDPDPQDARPDRLVTPPAAAARHHRPALAREPAEQPAWPWSSDPG